MKSDFYGVYAALLTPFDENNRVCKSRLKNLTEFLISKGINGLYVCGCTGEGPSMDVEERKIVLEEVKKIADNKIKIIAHVGGTLNTRDAVELARHASDIGADAVSSLTPMNNNYNFREIFGYYRQVSESTSLPFFIYYIPARTGLTITNQQMQEFGKLKNIIGLKYTNPDFFTLQDLMMQMKGKWISFSGPDELFLPALTMGVVGSIGSTQNVLPEIFIDIYENFKKGNMKEAMNLQQRITAAVSLLKKYDKMAAWKTALKFRRIDAGYARAPLQESLDKNAEEKFLEEWEEKFPDFTGK
jgi:N-acetylneuraminate lyase